MNDSTAGKIKVAIREWSEKTRLTFQETEHAGEDTLVFRPDGKGCYTNTVGYTQDYQITINIQTPGCDFHHVILAMQLEYGMNIPDPIRLVHQDQQRKYTSRVPDSI